MSHLNLCLLLNLFSNASDALRAARADGRHYVPLSLNRLGRVINTHGDILVSNAYLSVRCHENWIGGVLILQRLDPPKELI